MLRLPAADTGCGSWSQKEGAPRLGTGAPTVWARLGLRARGSEAAGRGGALGDTLAGGKALREDGAGSLGPVSGARLGGTGRAWQGVMEAPRQQVAVL